MINLRTGTKVLAGAAALALSLALAPAEGLAGYPERPVEFVQGFPPGDIEDLLTREIAKKMQEMTGVPTAVVNKPGGGASIAAVGVLQSPADGYVVGSFPLSVPIVHPVRGNADLKRDSFEPVVIFMRYPLMVVARKDAPYNSFPELAKASKDKPQKLGHFGFGVLPTLLVKKVIKDLGIEIAGDAAFDEVNCGTLLNGDADFAISTAQTVLPCLKSGEVKAIATFTEKRLPITPDSPTFAEQVPEMAVTTWHGFYVKKGTPQEVKDKLIEVTKAALEMESVKSLASQASAELMFLTGADAQAWVDKHYTWIESIIKEVGQ